MQYERMHELHQAVVRGAYDAQLVAAYYRANLPTQRLRWGTLLQTAARHPLFRDCTGVPRLFRSPGRSEIGGNHTDHNHGLAIVGTLCSDIIAVVVPRNDMRIRIHNLDDECTVDISGTSHTRLPTERGTSAALVRGVAAALHRHQVTLRGFDALTTSSVAEGGGLSSSAAFESLVTMILYRLSNAPPPLSIIDLAKVGQYAENEYFGKPCGLEDQIGTLNGGITQIDFAHFDDIKLQQLHIDFATHNLQLAVVDSQESHSALTEHYAAIPAEMKAIAAHYGKEVLRDVTREQVVDNATVLRAKYGDRAIMRALHFFRENERVHAQIAALRNGNIELLLQLVQQSGHSSWMLLQNCIVPGRVRTQAMAYALAITDEFILANNIETRAACRIHGGGFAGAIQVYIPHAQCDAYRTYIEAHLAPGVYLPLQISPHGTSEITRHTVS